MYRVEGLIILSQNTSGDYFFISKKELCASKYHSSQMPDVHLLSLLCCWRSQVWQHLMQGGVHAEPVHLSMSSAAAINRCWKQLSLFLATDFPFTALLSTSGPDCFKSAGGKRRAAGQHGLWCCPLRAKANSN